MSTKQVKGTLVPRHDIAKHWAYAKNFTPKKGELIVFDADTTTYDTTVTIDGKSYPVKSSTTTRFKIGDGVSNVNVLSFATHIEVAEDGESLIMGDGKDNIAGTKGFIIEKAQRITQEDGSYKYYYYLRDNSEVSLLGGFQKVLDDNTDVEKDIYVTYTLRLYHLNNNILEDGTYDKARENAEDYGKTYGVESTTIGNEPFLKVEVERIKRTYQPVPDSGDPADGIEDETAKDGWRYTWKQIGDSNVYEIDYTDTYEDYTDDSSSDPNAPAYSYFRLSVAPELGTNWLPTDGLVAGGSNNRALGNNSIVAGKDNTANGAISAVFGNDNYANYAGFVGGRDNKVLEKSGFAAGEHNINKGYAAAVLGGRNEVGNHSHSAAIGSFLKTHNSNEVVIGSYNIPQEQLDKDSKGAIKSVALSVGAGWDNDHRKDAMTVYRDGTTKILGDVYSGSTNVTQAAKDAKTTATNANTTATNANTTATKANTTANEAKDIANKSNDSIKELENKTILQLGNLPEIGEVNKLYIDDQDSQWIYKVRKTPKVENVWDGVIPTTIPSTLQGTGTKDDPYQITDGNELAYIIKYTTGKYSKLMNDIYLNDISNPDWKDTANEWIPCSSSRYYNGEFDGQNHTVYGLYYNNPEDYATNPYTGKRDFFRGCALFPYISNGFLTTPIVIKNIGLDYVYVNSSTCAGSLVGATQTSNYEVKNCWIGENVELIGEYVADIHTYGNGKALIENCYSLSTQSVTTGNRKAFLQADWWNHNPPGPNQVTDTYPTIKNCYTYGNKLTYKNMPQMVVENCYCTEAGGKGTVITKEDMTGINALDNMPGLNTYIEGGKKALGKNKLEYFNELENGSYNSNTGYANTDLNEDGTIYIDSAGYVPDKTGEPETISIPIGRIVNYDSNNSYIASCDIQSIEDYPFYANTSFELLDDILYFNITPQLGEPGSFYNIYPQVEEGTEDTEWEKPNIVEIEGNGWVYINDYTYPHLASFADGWKNIGNNAVNPNIVNYLQYEVTEGRVTITGYKEGLPVDVVIPDFIDGYPVTSIGEYAFASCTSLTSITIPDSVTSIGEGAFEYCTSLTKVNITDIAAWCNIDFEDYYANPLNYAKKLYLNDELVTNLVIPDTVTNIGRNAFYDCDSLTSVTIGGNVTSIGYNAFWGCNALTSVTISDSVTSIGNYAFAYCDSLTSVTIGNSVTSIGYNAFYNCTSLTSVYYRGSENDRNNITIDSSNEDLTGATWHYNYSFDAVYDELNSLKTLVTELQSRITELENK